MEWNGLLQKFGLPETVLTVLRLKILNISSKCFKLLVDWSPFLKKKKKSYWLNPALWMKMAGYHQNFSLCLRPTRSLTLSLSRLYSFACTEMDLEIFTAGWALSLIALNPHSPQAKLTAVDWPCPFGLFSRNDSVLTDALAEKGKRGAKIVSKEPLFY